MALVIDRELMGKPRQKHWISYVKQRIRQNKNFLGAVVGPTGSGKSYTSLRICEELDPDFSIDRVVFGGLALMELVVGGKLKRGSAICFEETGVEMSAKNWHSLTNRLLNNLIQTFRHRGFILIMNSPFLDFIDKSTRKLFHAELRTVSINYDKMQVKLAPRTIQYNSRYQKFYFKRLKVKTELGACPIDFWNVDKPSKELLEAYEKKKINYTTKLNQDMLGKLKAEQEKDGRLLTEKQEVTIQALKDGLLPDAIAESQGVHKRSIQAQMQLAGKKGYRLIPVWTESVGDSPRRVCRYDVYAPGETPETS